MIEVGEEVCVTHLFSGSKPERGVVTRSDGFGVAVKFADGYEMNFHSSMIDSAISRIPPLRLLAEAAQQSAMEW